VFGLGELRQGELRQGGVWSGWARLGMAGCGMVFFIWSVQLKKQLQQMGA
jgi:hypothetical protein